jgi:hypothetical protein
MMRRAKFRIKLMAGVGVLAAAFLAVPQGAYAATTHSSTSAVAKVSGPVHLVTIEHGHAKPDAINTEGAYPRLNLAGCSRQDGFNGSVTWGTLPNAPYVELSGNLWDVCGTALQVYVQWYSPTYHNDVFGSIPAWGNTDFDVMATGMVANPGRIQVTVCGWWRAQWTCGTPFKV